MHVSWHAEERGGGCAVQEVAEGAQRPLPQPPGRQGRPGRSRGHREGTTLPLRALCSRRATVRLMSKMQCRGCAAPLRNVLKLAQRVLDTHQLIGQHGSTTRALTALKYTADGI